MNMDFGGLSYTGPVNPSNLPKVWQIWWIGWAYVARPLKVHMSRVLPLYLAGSFHTTVFMSIFVCVSIKISK